MRSTSTRRDSAVNSEVGSRVDGKSEAESKAGGDIVHNVEGNNGQTGLMQGYGQQTFDNANGFNMQNGASNMGWNGTPDYNQMMQMMGNGMMPNAGMGGFPNMMGEFTYRSSWNHVANADLARHERYGGGSDGSGYVWRLRWARDGYERHEHGNGL